MSASFNFSGKILVRKTLLKKSFKNGAHESLQFPRTFPGISLSVPAFLVLKERISLFTSFISTSSKENILSWLITFILVGHSNGSFIYLSIFICL